MLQFKIKKRFPIVLMNLLLFSIMASSQVSDSLFSEFTYRNFNVARVGAWISDIAVPANPDTKNKFTFYIAARNGGVWKTSNNGTTFSPVFDNYGTNSIGAIEVAPSDPEIIWVGTGEASNARSAYVGNGIYKSENGGKTFENMGLRNSQHISKVIIHPQNPSIVYVAVMGHLFSTNKERGVFKTSDGGKSWEKVLFINDYTGVIDLVMDPVQTETLYAAAYEKERTPWHYQASGKGSRIYKTMNGGKTWEELSGGLPKGNLGRIGIDVYAKNPKIIYTVIENLNQKPDYIEKKKGGAFDPMRDPYFDKFIGGEVYRSENGGKTWKKMNADSVNVSSKAAYSFNQIWVAPNDDNDLFINSVHLNTSTDKGKTWQDVDWPPTQRFLKMFGDVRTFWIDKNDSRHMIIGSDGGVYVSWDGGKTTDHLNNLPLGEVYNVETDMDDPYHIYMGLQDHEIWKAPSNGWSGQIGPEDWSLVGKWDGMYGRVDPEDNQLYYSTTQFGSHLRINQKTGERFDIMPVAPEGEPVYRFTWNTPLEVSLHQSGTIYAGAQMLLRSSDRGDSWEEISPDLTRNDSVKIAGKGHMMFCTITSIAESPVSPGVIWAGTDDGRVHLTRDNGKTWKEFTAKIAKAGGPADMWVSRIIASSHHPGTAYVAKSGYRNDDFRPFLFATTNYGKNWKNIASNLPDQPVSVIREDPENPDLLFVGNDIGVYFSLDKGKNWFPLKNNMPPVPVKDLKIQTRKSDLIAGTYGRGVFVTNIAPLEEFTAAVQNKDIYLFKVIPQPAMNYSEQANWGNYQLMGDRNYFTPNEKNGLQLWYYLKNDVTQPVKIEIYDTRNKVVDQLDGKQTSGIHKLIWPTKNHAPGTYTIVLKQGGNKLTRKTLVEKKLLWPVGNKCK